MPPIDRVIARGQLVPLTFMQSDAANSQTNAALTVAECRDTAATADDQNAADGYTIPWDFEVVAVSVRVAAADARTAGTLTVEPLVNGSATGLTTALDATNTQGSKAVQLRGSDTAAAGGKVGARITTASWTPVTADVVVTVWVLVYLEGI
ncbi:MAG TPA: hypothetical protein VMU51_34225 [Mycobacteriales bacterium]|nr:hypothetical protein [Mycobacteriales bacterium]